MDAQQAIELAFEPDGDVLREFHLDNSFVRGIRGPIGSGKSSSCCIELFRRAVEQKPGPDGIRHTRMLAVRNTQPELKTTTIKTWLAWFPEDQFGRFNWSPPFTHRIRVGDVDLEMIFLALDSEDDVKKLYSLELTMAWVNEARFVDQAVVKTLTERVNRFPAVRDGGPTFAGVIMDTNAMDPDHWWPIVAGDVPLPDDIPEEEALMLQKPENWRFFNQPGAMLEETDGQGRTTGWRLNPQAENLRFLPTGYYQNLIQGKTRSEILRNVANRLVVVKEGRAVYRHVSEDVHFSAAPLPILPRQPVEVGIDFGLTPAAVVGQSLHGRVMVQRELVSTNMGMTTFAPILKQLLMRDYPGCPVHVTGDPAGEQRAQTDEKTPFMILKAAGIEAVPAPTNDFTVRVEAVEGLFKRLVDGKPGILIDPSCRHLRKAVAGGYHYPKLQVTGEVRYADRPLKNMSSHVAEALQYLALGLGEGSTVLLGGSGGKFKAVRIEGRSSPHERLRRPAAGRRR
jgi:hypothetical protein